MKKRILFCGEHPLSVTGNGGMLAAVLSQLDASKYDITCFCAGDIDDSILAFNRLPFPIISASDKEDFWGKEKLLKLIQSTSFDILCFLGIEVKTMGTSLKGAILLRINSSNSRCVFVSFSIKSHLLTMITIPFLLRSAK